VAAPPPPTGGGGGGAGINVVETECVKPGALIFAQKFHIPKSDLAKCINFDIEKLRINC
jgi:hypothetical protein